MEDIGYQVVPCTWCPLVDIDLTRHTCTLSGSTDCWIHSPDCRRGAPPIAGCVLWDARSLLILPQFLAVASNVLICVIIWAKPLSWRTDQRWGSRCQPRRRVDEDLHRERGNDREGQEKIKRHNFSRSVNHEWMCGTLYIAESKRKATHTFGCTSNGKLALDDPATIECQPKVPRPRHCPCTQYNWNGIPSHANGGAYSSNNEYIGMNFQNYFAQLLRFWFGSISQLLNPGNWDIAIILLY